jgi:hypothetical protein
MKAVLSLLAITDPSRFLTIFPKFFNLLYMTVFLITLGLN